MAERTARSRSNPFCSRAFSDFCRRAMEPMKACLVWTLVAQMGRWQGWWVACGQREGFTDPSKALCLKLAGTPEAAEGLGAELVGGPGIQYPALKTNAAASLAGGEHRDGAGGAQLVGQAPGAGRVDAARRAGVVEDQDAVGVARAAAADLDQADPPCAQERQDQAVGEGQGIAELVARHGVHDHEVGQVRLQAVGDGVVEEHEDLGRRIRTQTPGEDGRALTSDGGACQPGGMDGRPGTGRQGRGSPRAGCVFGVRGCHCRGGVSDVSRRPRRRSSALRSRRFAVVSRSRPASPGRDTAGGQSPRLIRQEAPQTVHSKAMAQESEMSRCSPPSAAQTLRGWGLVTG